MSADFWCAIRARPIRSRRRRRSIAVEELPDEVLVYLLGSRYCDTDRLSDTAWSLFGGTPPGWARVQAICDYVHRAHRVRLRTRRPDPHGLGRTFASGAASAATSRHLAVAFCRCMNIPARYCTGYLGDIGVPPVDAPMDFSAWFEAWLGGRWHTFDARHNVPRIGRILMARGRDATDVAIATTFGPCTLAAFRVVTEAVDPEPAAAPPAGEGGAVP